MKFLLVFMLFLFCSIWSLASGKERRYEKAYACEGQTLNISCRKGSFIHLIRANFGRFSINTCNDHLDNNWNVNCMAIRSIGVLQKRCSMQQNCSTLASTSIFGDPCPNTLKYLEAHYQCVPASPTTTKRSSSPPRLTTPQPIQPVPSKNQIQQVQTVERENVDDESIKSKHNIVVRFLTFIEWVVSPLGVSL